MISRMLKSFAPLAALAMGAALSGCGNVDMKINGKEGVPLSELDMTDAAPTELVVSANATVVVSEGDTLTISVEDDPEDALRFVLDNETLGVTLDPDREIKDGKAIVNVTMPAPETIVIGGIGRVEAATVANGTVELVMGGSGAITVEEIATETLEVSIGGSGSVKGAGTTQNLEVSIGGAGRVEMPGLKADKAEVSIGGAGSVSFASDGEVEASIAGSGNVNVTGNAKCTVSAFGAGTLTCTPTANGNADATSEAEDETSADEETTDEN